jgi:cytochrome c oxidase assembly factor CtaG
VLAAWNVEPILVAVLGVAGVVYLRGWRRLRARRPGRIGMRHLVAFLAGLGTLFVALASPLDTLADRLLALHMAQHIVLLVVTPPLLLFGAPLVPFLFGLPAGRARWLLGRCAARIDDWLGHPLVGLLAMSLATWGWHAPPAFELALHDRGWHVVEHASFLSAGLLFWWPVVRPWPYRRRWPRPAMIPYLLVADVQNTALAAILVFADRVLYPSYGSGPAALADQVVAGVLMWVPMSLAYLVPAGVLTVRWLSPDTGRASGDTGA